MTLINTTPLEFSELNDVYREYDYIVDGEVVTVTIEQPRYLNVNPAHGAHRIVDSKGVCHYVPCGWITLRWAVPEGTPQFHVTVAQSDGTKQQTQHS